MNTDEAKNIMHAVKHYNLLRYPDAAKYLHVAETTLRKWACKKKIPHIKIGGRVLFDISELNKIIESNMVGVQQ